jgi:hypothetical protein
MSGRVATAAIRIGYNNGIYNIVAKRLANNGDLEYKNSNVELRSESQMNLPFEVSPILDSASPIAVFLLGSPTRRKS